jgi:anti-sigma factor RsiW
MWGFTECRSVSDQLWNYTAHRLSEDEVERVERHLNACGACRTEAEAYRQTVDALTAIRRQPIPESQRGWHELQARLTAPDRRSAASRSMGWPSLTWVTAAVAAALLFVFLFHPGAKEPLASPPGDRVASGAQTPGQREVASTQPGPSETTAPAAASGSQPIAKVHPAPTRFRHSSEEVAVLPPTRSTHRSIRWSSVAAASTAGRPRLVATRSPLRRGAPKISARQDDGAASANVEGSGYVLTPVAATSESDMSTQYVMGSVVMSSRSADPEVASGW